MVHSLFGVLGLSAIAWALSENRRQASWKVAVGGIAVQFVVALLLLKVPASQALFVGLGRAVDALATATRAGTSFVFGYLGGGAAPFGSTHPEASFVLAFQALPLVLVMSALSAILYHWRILPLVVRGFSWLLERTMSIGGAVGLSAAANAFVGMVEAPLLIRPYISTMSRGELFVTMTAGMGTIAGTVMVLYATFLQGVIPDPAGHLLTASLISVPASVMVAKLMIPDDARTGTDLQTLGKPYTSTMDAITQGTQDGVQLLIGIIAMLVTLVALVSLANMGLGLLPDLDGAPVTLQRMLAWLMIPIVWLMGIPWSEAGTAGQLMGIKTVLNELLAYLELAKLPPEALSERSRLIMTYALCGFANFGSLGIMIAGLSAMAPERRSEIVGLGMKSILSGTLTTLLTGAVAGVLL